MGQNQSGDVQRLTDGLKTLLLARTILSQCVEIALDAEGTLMREFEGIPIDPTQPGNIELDEALREIVTLVVNELWHGDFSTIPKFQPPGVINQAGQLLNDTPPPHTCIPQPTCSLCSDRFNNRADTDCYLNSSKWSSCRKCPCAN